MMQKNVLIDPHMFKLEDTEEIESNILFFQEIINLCSSGNLAIYMYMGLYEKVLSGEVCPFSIGIDTFLDDRTKEKIRILNGNFRRIIVNNLVPLDIDDCGGEQHYTASDQRMLEDDLYYELISILVKPCYSPQLSLSDNILTGQRKNSYFKRNEITEVSCECQGHKFNRKYSWIFIDQLLTDKDKAYYWLQSAVKNKSFSYNPEPEVVRGKHHNMVQKKSFNNFKDLSTKNKRVLKLLRLFGLSKVIFESFQPDNSCPVGTITVQQVTGGHGVDIVIGNFYAETEFKISVNLYFPEKVGSNLNTYLDGEFNYINVERVKDSLGLDKV